MSFKTSTQTIIGYGNSVFDISLLFKELSNYKLLGNKDGILSIEYLQKLFRECNKEETHPNSTKYFSNALTLTVWSIDKVINVKLSKNGKLQCTGCRSTGHAQYAIQYLVRIIKTLPSCRDICPGIDTFEMHFISVMLNVGFSCNYIVDKTKFTKLVETLPGLQASFAYTAGLKLVVNNPETIDYNVPYYNSKNDYFGDIKLSEFIQGPHKLSTKILTPMKKSTFIVFHSGSIIMSSFNLQYAERDFKYFQTLLSDYRVDIEEKLKKSD